MTFGPTRRMARGARRVVRAAFRHVGERLAPAPERAENPYATHIPVLACLGRLFPFQTILEYGCGVYSTLAFLDRTVFPHVQALISYENDHGWADHVANMTSDPRLRLRCADVPMWQQVDPAEVASADLVFIDDSTCAADRVRTIRSVLGAPECTAVIVVHDYDVPQYQEALKTLRDIVVFDHALPYTAVRGTRSGIRILRRCRRTAKRLAARLPLDDLRLWHQHFRS